MATIQDINDLFERAQRINARINIRAGDGAEWKVEIPRYGLQTYRITGVRSPEEIEDDFASLAVWVWSLKDYFKEHLSSLGRDPKEVEAFVNSETDLQVCADIANGAKHSKLKKSRTGRHLRVERLRFSIPQSAVTAFAFGSAEVQIDVSQPDLVKIEFPVLDGTGKVVGEGILYLRNAMDAWERYYDRLGLGGV